MERKHSVFNHWSLRRNLARQLFLLPDGEAQTISLPFFFFFFFFIVERLKQTIDNIAIPMKMVEYLLPNFPGNLVIVGDLIREVVAHEVKISETCYIPVRSFGLEQFLHGPRVTLDKQSSLVAFTSMTEPRKDSLIKYAETIGAEVVEINEKTFNGVSKEFTWLAQLLYGQQLALELSKRLGTNPDTIRPDQSPYKEARDLLIL